MIAFICLMFCVALFAAFIIIFLVTTGLRELVVATAPRFVSQLFSCDYCLSWWVAVVLSVVAAVIMGDAALLLIPFMSTPITRALL